MKVRAAEREFNVFELFLHDDEAAGTRPFDGWEVSRVLNDKATNACPESYVWFVSPDESGLSYWSVRFRAGRYDVEKDGSIGFQTYPGLRTHDEREFRSQLPPELDELLLELNKAVLEL